MMSGNALSRLNVIGCGRVGQTLAKIFHALGICQIQHLKSRDVRQAADAANFIGAGVPVSQLDQMAAAELWLLSVPDTSISDTAQALSEVMADQSDTSAQQPIVFHCSGFKTADALAALRLKHVSLASVHPVLSFASPVTATQQFRGTACGMEGDAYALQVLKQIFSAAGGLCFEIDAASKPLYHAAAVFCTNFTVVMQALAREAWHDSGVPPELTSQIQSALLRTTVENVLSMGPGRAITGPAARGDVDVVKAQGALVTHWHPQAGEVYRILSSMARALALTQSTHGLVCNYPPETAGNQR